MFSLIARISLQTTTCTNLAAKNVVSDDFFNFKNAAIRGRKPKSSDTGPSDVCRINALVLGKTSYVSTQNVFRRCYTVWHSSTTIWNFASIRFPLFSENNLYFASTAIREACCPLLTRRWKESSSITCSCSSMMVLGSETMRTTTFAPFAFLFSWHRIDVSDFLQTRSAKLQKSVSDKEYEQQLPLFLIFNLYYFSNLCYIQFLSTEF